MKRLIVNADDLGRSPGVNQGILDAHRKGIVTSSTLMINLPDAPAALDLMAAQAPHLGIGLHFNLTFGPPVAPPESVASLLGDNGQFRHISQWPAHYDSMDPDQMRREVRAQFERFQQVAGQPPDHLDAHHHATYLHPAALETMLALAAEHDLPLRESGLDPAALDETIRRLHALLPSLPDDFTRSLLDRLHAVIAASAAPRWPARFVDTFYDSKATLGHLLVILTTLPDDSTTEIMCHPGYVDDVLAGSGYVERREEEVEHLTNAATRECVQAEGIRLITFGDV